MIKKQIRANTKKAFISVLKERLLDGYGVNIDENGEPTETELLITNEIICVATEMDFKTVEKELSMFFVDNRSKENKITVLFSSEYLADELLSTHRF